MIGKCESKLNKKLIQIKLLYNIPIFNSTYTFLNGIKKCFDSQMMSTTTQPKTLYNTSLQSEK